IDLLAEPGRAGERELDLGVPGRELHQHAWKLDVAHAPPAGRARSMVLRPLLRRRLTATGNGEMRIQRVQIEGYRALQKVDLPLRNLNVLIGPNGSGKSTFLDAFSLLA